MEIVKQAEDFEMVVATVDESGQTTNVAGEVVATELNMPTDDEAVRFWAGATFENRETAPFRVLQNGAVIAQKATVNGAINAISGSIGGFEIADGRIGVIPDDPNVEYDGLGITNNMLKYSEYEFLDDSRQIAAIGNDVNPNGIRMLARFEYTDKIEDEDSIQNGIALKVKYRPGYEHPWYTQRAFQYDGNMFGVGGHCNWSDTYIGQASSDALETFIGISNEFVFTSIGSETLGVRLPTKSHITSKTTKPVTFLLHILVPAGVANRIRLLSQTNGQMYNNDGAAISYRDMAAGDVLVLRYHNGGWYTVTYNT